uniref:alcohol dehydrogenase catalytic domain-containing protein n=1 Tax=Armatimonas sp. TaxID=1872638 RepID=UPI00286C8A70
MAFNGRAAVLTEAGKDVELIDISVAEPAPDDAVIEVVASGVCHTDLTIKLQQGAGMKFPIILGHEGAGIVKAVGSNVTHLKPGDPVVIAYRAPCGSCPACRRGDPRRCYMALRPTTPITRVGDDARCSQVLRCGTFSTMTVVNAKAAIKMPENMPLDKACLLACGVITGVGATMNTTQVWPGASVAVVGCGGVGLSVIQGAKIQGAKQIIGVDVNPTKLEWAKKFGATHLVNALDGDPVAAVRNLVADDWPGYEGGVDFAFEATGLMKCIEQAVRMVNYNGTAVNIGFPGKDAEVTLNVGNIDTGVYWNKVNLKVCHCGDALPSHDFPLLAQ